MDKQRHIEYWLKTSQYDLDCAFSMLDSGRYDWALFVGHLAIEKLLKAFWVKRNDSNVPPRIHNLVKLAKEAKLSPSAEDIKFLEEVTDYNIETRYPDYKFEFYKLCTKEFSTEQLRAIKDYYVCTRLKL